MLAHCFDLDGRHAVGRDQPDIDIAVACAEAAMGEAADEIKAEEPLAELLLPIIGDPAREAARVLDRRRVAQCSASILASSALNASSTLAPSGVALTQLSLSGSSFFCHAAVCSGVSSTIVRLSPRAMVVSLPTLRSPSHHAPKARL